MCPAVDLAIEVRASHQFSSTACIDIADPTDVRGRDSQGGSDCSGRPPGMLSFGDCECSSSLVTDIVLRWRRSDTFTFSRPSSFACGAVLRPYYESAISCEIKSSRGPGQPRPWRPLRDHWTAITDHGIQSGSRRRQPRVQRSLVQEHLVRVSSDSRSRRAATTARSASISRCRVRQARHTLRMVMAAAAAACRRVRAVSSVCPRIRTVWYRGKSQ